MNILSDKQGEAYRLMSEGHNVVLLGAAGTGKSFILKGFVEEQRKCGKNITLTCTTGIACSVNSEVVGGAMTIHKWSGNEDGRYDPSEIVDVVCNNRKYHDVVQ
ncbi:hypothetical protein DPMN_160759 [Dreissena polymorpha]|uniref:ATP-dependent DNA helicase n=1 Tax=Dreissena polymorpha TaxID=45954 RepID=A0A9D4IRY0_DREPO|nr:hypothetical protein DPMN_160759 [Dreissena polymorpha]